MNSIFLKGLALLTFIFSYGHTTLPDYFWGLAPISYQNLNGIQIQYSDDLTLNGSRGDVYRYITPRMQGQSKWIGLDINASFSYRLLQAQSLSVFAGAAYHLVLIEPNLRESNPSIQLDFQQPLGFITFEQKNNFEIRYLQRPPIYPDTGANRNTYYTWDPQIKIRTSEEYTKLRMTPFVLWQGHIQNKRSQPTYAYPRIAMAKYIVPFYNEVEMGFQARLLQELGLGISDRFMFLPTRSKTGSHRIMTYLTWYIDLSQISGK
jgi:hypothetical protein